jgi:hypothetical protein
MLLYLVIHSGPDLSNSMRELSKVVGGATEGHAMLLNKVIGYVLNTKDKRVVMKPKSESGIVAYVDSDYAGDRKTDDRSLDT